MKGKQARKSKGEIRDDNKADQLTKGGIAPRELRDTAEFFLRPLEIRICLTVEHIQFFSDLVYEEIDGELSDSEDEDSSGHRQAAEEEEDMSPVYGAPLHVLPLYSNLPVARQRKVRESWIASPGSQPTAGLYHSWLLTSLFYGARIRFSRKPLKAPVSVSCRQILQKLHSRSLTFAMLLTQGR